MITTPGAGDNFIRDVTKGPAQQRDYVAGAASFVPNETPLSFDP